MRTKLFSSALVAVTLLVSAISQASATVVHYAGTGIWDSQAPTTDFSAGGKGWSFSFDLDSPASNPSTAVTNFTYTLGGNLLGLSLDSITFYSSADFGMFKLTLSNGVNLNFFDAAQTDIGSTGVLSTGTWNVEVESYIGPFDTRVHGTGVVAAVPEPSTWAMMIFGFGAVGFMAYRRRRVAMA